MDEQPKITDKLIIKNSVWGIKDIFSVIGLIAIIGLFIIDYYLFHSLVFFLILVLPFSVLLSQILNKSIDTTEKIEIDKNGITISTNHEFVPWPAIKYAYIQEHSSGFGKTARVTAYFHICTKEREILVNISKLKYDPELLKKSIESFSGRNIGDYADVVSENILKIIGDEEEVHKIESKLSDYFKKQLKSAPFIVLGSFGIAIVLQMLITFPYIIAIWWAILVFGSMVYAIYEGKTLKKRLELNGLSDKQFTSIKEEYGSEYELNYNKKQTFFLYAFLLLSVFAVFGFSYYFDISRKERENDKQKEKTEIINSVHNSVYKPLLAAGLRK